MLKEKNLYFLRVGKIYIYINIFAILEDIILLKKFELFFMLLYKGVLHLFSENMLINDSVWKDISVNINKKTNIYPIKSKI